MISVPFQYLKGGYRKEEDRLFGMVFCDKTMRNSFKLKKESFILDIREKKKNYIHVVRFWRRLPRDVMDAPSLEMFKVSLGGALSNLI